MGYISIEEVYKRIQEKDMSIFFTKLDIPNKKQNIVRKRGGDLAKSLFIYFCIKKQISFAKQSAFTNAANNLYLFKEYHNLTIFNDYVGVISISLALLSDNETLISNIANAGKDIDIPRKNKGSLNLMLQCAMRDDIEGLKEAMDVYEKYAIKKEWDELQVAFYKAYIDQDESRIKEVLTKLETPNLKRQSIFYKEFIDDYLSVLTTAYLKLCWRKGMEIHIDSPTVPMEMMPIAPLDHYEVEYPYLKGWEKEDKSPFPSPTVEKIYEEVGPYPTSNPTLRSKFVSIDTVRETVDRFCPKHTKEEKDALTVMIWEAYTDPEHFDYNHKDYVQKNASWPDTNKNEDQVMEARPFWSELTEYDDEGYFRYCTSFIVMGEMNITPDEVDAYLLHMKENMDKKDGSFFKKLFS